MRSLILDLMTPGNRAPDGLKCGYDRELDMSRLPDGRIAIDVRGIRLATKKRDMEKGEDQKDRW
jgi:hypothetical protein